MFKRTCLLLALVMLLGIVFAGCGNGGGEPEATLVIAGEDFGDEMYGVGFRPADISFINEVNTALNALIDDGTAASISEEWFGDDIVYVPDTPAADVAATDDSWAKIQEKGKFVVGLDDSFPPMGFRGSSNEIEGFDVDFAKAVAQYLGVEVEFVSIDWGSKELELKQGNIDVVWNGLTMSDTRINSGEWGFSQPYLENKQIILTLSDSGIDTIADLAGKKVGVQFDSSAQEAVEEQPEILATFADFVKLDTYTMLIMELKSKNIDAVVGDEILIKYVMAKDAEI